jgi:hypothetical protein
MVEGMGCKGMTFCATGFPPWCPVLAQRAIAFFGRFVGRKESDFHVLAIQHIGNQRRDTHVASIKGEV